MRKTLMTYIYLGFSSLEIWMRQDAPGCADALKPTTHGWSGENEKRILELRAGANSWNILDITLENGRHQHVVIPL